MTDSLDLPAKRNSNTVITLKQHEIQLIEAQMTALVNGGVKAVEDIGQISKDVVGIVKDIVAIVRINEQSKADIQKIEAETKKAVAAVRAEIDRLVTLGENTRTRGEVAVKIIRELTAAINDIPDGDDKSRYCLIDQIHKIVEIALRPESREA